MTKKDYVAIAAILKGAGDNWRDANGGRESPVIRSVAEELARVMARDNPHFGWARFMTAAGVTP